MATGLQPDQMAQVAWFTRAGQQHVFLIGRLQTGEWMLCNNAQSPVFEPRPVSMASLRSIVLQAMQSRTSWLHPGTPRTSTTRPTTQRAPLRSPSWLERRHPKQGARSHRAGRTSSARSMRGSSEPSVIVSPAVSSQGRRTRRLPGQAMVSDGPESGVVIGKGQRACSRRIAQRPCRATPTWLRRDSMSTTRPVAL